MSYEVRLMSPNSEYVWPCCNLVDSVMGGAVDGASALSSSYVSIKALALTPKWLSSCTRVPEVSLLNEVLAACRLCQVGREE